MELWNSIKEWFKEDNEIWETIFTGIMGTLVLLIALFIALLLYSVSPYALLALVIVPTVIYCIGRFVKKYILKDF